jgi:hypothetical protein
MPWVAWNKQKNLRKPLLNNLFFLKKTGRPASGETALLLFIVQVIMVAGYSNKKAG